MTEIFFYLYQDSFGSYGPASNRYCHSDFFFFPKAPDSETQPIKQVNLSRSGQVRVGAKHSWPWLYLTCANSHWNAPRHLFIVQSPSHAQRFATPWNAAWQASLSLTISRSLPKFISIASVKPSNHLILWHPLLLLLSIFPSIRKFSSISIRDFSPDTCILLKAQFKNGYWTASFLNSCLLNHCRWKPTFILLIWLS